MKAFPKLQKGAERTLGLNWAGWLPEGVTISSVAVAVDVSGITLANETVSGGITTVEVTATQEGCYQITFTPTLSDGDIEPRTARLNVVEYKSA